jgi:hypothetical protein
MIQPHKPDVCTLGKICGHTELIDSEKFVTLKEQTEDVAIPWKGIFSYTSHII